MKYLKKFNENVDVDNTDEVQQIRMNFLKLIRENGDISDIEKVLSDYLKAGGERMVYFYCLSAERGRPDVMKLVSSMDREYNEEAKKWLIHSYKFRNLSDDVKNSVIEITGEPTKPAPYSNDDPPYTGEE